jgi:alkylation response protein AidB-like acyl-CoA dehydrogenase
MSQPITLTDEQREFRAVVRQFAADKIVPLAAEADRNAEYSWAAFDALKAMELTALSYPEEYGGSGASLVDQAIVAEELARADASTSLMFLISKLGMLPVLNFGSEELKQTYVPRIASGESQASYALSEADAGSDVASMTTRAVRDGDDWVISGPSAGSPTPASPTCTPCSPARPRTATPASRRSFSRPTGASWSTSSSTSSASRARPPA